MMSPELNPIAAALIDTAAPSFPQSRPDSLARPTHPIRGSDVVGRIADAKGRSVRTALALAACLAGITGAVGVRAEAWDRAQALRVAAQYNNNQDQLNRAKAALHGGRAYFSPS